MLTSSLTNVRLLIYVLISDLLFISSRSLFPHLYSFCLVLISFWINHSLLPLFEGGFRGFNVSVGFDSPPH
jgi:hypothetical protein